MSRLSLEVGTCSSSMAPGSFEVRSMSSVLGDMFVVAFVLLYFFLEYVRAYCESTKVYSVIKRRSSEVGEGQTKLTARY
jgi:hypothetical protein